MWITLVVVGFIALRLRLTGLSLAQSGGKGGDSRLSAIMLSILETGGSTLVLIFAVALLL
jgi:hypothetical protein